MGKSFLNAVHLKMVSERGQRKDLQTAEPITQGAHYLMNQMILTANQRKNQMEGDPKVGGHSSASSSALHILGALHLLVRRGFDFIANKPHASPADHAYHYLLNLFLDKNLKPLSKNESEGAMANLRAFSNKENPYVFQSYHSHYDPDHQNFLPSGTVGIPPAALGYLALAFQFAKNKGWEAAPAHFWALIGDSEFREGSLFEAIPDLAERKVGALTWIIDYNRQSLDGHRSSLESLKTDDSRIEKTFLANGWEVIQVRHGCRRQKLFEKEGGGLFKNFFEDDLNDIELQILLQIKNEKDLRHFILKKSPRLKSFIEGLSDDVLFSAVKDLGGHDLAVISQALEDSKKDKTKPCCVIAHTIKGFGLKMAAQPDNHSALPDQAELLELKNKTKLKKNEGNFPHFEESSDEALFLKKRGEELLKQMQTAANIKTKNKERFLSSVEKLPSELGISFERVRFPHTQWMLGQWVSKLSRIASSHFKDLKEDEKPFHFIAKMFVGLSPDVGTSTNLSFSMDGKIYNPAPWGDDELKWNIENKKSPNLNPSAGEKSRFLRFEIAEAAALSCMAAFGKMKEIIGASFLPLMSVYDFFIKRALDQYFYSLYWGSRFILAGTPSGVTLSPEGAQHGWKSDFQIPGQITWEPYFCKEMDWILTHSLSRFVQGRDEGRSGVLVRAVTRGADQKKFLHYLKMQARFKKNLNGKKLSPVGFSFGAANVVEESQVEAMESSEIFSQIRKEVLNGAYFLMDYRGYADYSPGENVVYLFAMGALGTEACLTSEALLKKGIYANVVMVTSPDLLLGLQGHEDEYAHLKSIVGDGSSSIVSVHDGEPGLLDNMGSILGRKQITLAVRKHSVCGRPVDVNQYHGIDTQSIIKACLHSLTT